MNGREVGTIHPAVGVLLTAAVVLLPAWGNRGPGTSSLADALLVPLVLWWIVDALRGSVASLPPYAVPGALLVLAGAVAGVQGAFPGASLQAVAGDLYLLLVALAATRVVGAPGPWARRVALGWVVGATLWSIPLLLSRAGAVPASAGGLLVTSERRAFGTFANPNLAGSYYALSLLLVLAVVAPRRWRLSIAGVLLCALAMTGSLAAFGGLALGAAALLIRRLLRRTPRRGWIPVALVGTALVILLGPPGPALAAWGMQAAQSSALHDSVGRLDRSDSTRFELWSLAATRFGDRLIVGVGPGAAGPELRADANTGKSLHSDVLASLVERGLLGALALALLLVVTAVSSWRLASQRVPWLPAPAALSAAALCLAPGLLTHEILHFRHVWLLLGLLAGAGTAAARAELGSHS